MPDLHKIRLPAGWYPDPDGADHRRWWDGTTWTQHTAPFQRPVQVYDVDDLIEPRAATGGAASGEPAVTPAPRRIRTAARLGRGLAALAHRLPFGLPAVAEQDEAEGPQSAPPSPPTAPQKQTAHKQTAQKQAAHKETAQKPVAKKPAAKKPAARQKAAPTPPAQRSRSQNGRHAR